ncbi:LytR/AlgR family response regulator transcription factor [Zhouia sp. PK063]|uniref:LytR/AlgR family response regulator transcription factor n=1 Tax=Zhouia sp. PK063 TaxID=3373602 RepID=UPI0037A59814
MIGTYTTIIIDDEALARQRLQELLQDFQETFTVIATATNGKEGVALIQKLQPKVVFLDIQMPGMTGFEMLQQLTHIPFVIFCTAYDEYSLQAFETQSVDYLLKPVRKDRLAQTVKKLNAFHQQPEQLLQFLAQLSNSKPKKQLTSITVKKGKKMVFIKLGDVTYFKANDKYVSFYTKEGEEFITEQTLLKLEEELPDNFLRIQRSVIININAVKEVQTYFNSRYIITLEDKLSTKVTSGRNYNDIVKDWLSLS